MNMTKNASCTYFFPLLLSKIFKDEDHLGIMNYVEDTFMFSKNEDIFVLRLNINHNSIENNKIDQKLLDELIKSKLTVDVKYDSNSIILYFKIPEDLFEAKNAIIKGSFSKIPVNDKSDILQFVFMYGEDDFKVYKKVSSILKKDPKLKSDLLRKYKLTEKDIPEDIELRSKINVKNETYIEKFNE